MPAMTAAFASLERSELSARARSRRPDPGVTEEAIAESVAGTQKRRPAMGRRLPR
jgi:hypothetical protein